MAHTHPTEICCVATYNDLVAIGGESSVEVILATSKDEAQLIATFATGVAVTALTWSSRTVSPSESADGWRIELAVAGTDLNTRLLTKTATHAEALDAWGGGLSGHHGKINSMAFSEGTDGKRYVATASDDKMLIIWDLDPPESDPLSEFRKQATAYTIEFAHPLDTVTAHHSSAKEFVVSDIRGSVFLIDWRVELANVKEEPWRRHSVAELIHPKTLADSRTGLRTIWRGGGASWKPSDPDIIGATYGDRWAMWDLRRLQGGKPVNTGQAFWHGSHRFRWCPTDPQVFAISTQSPASGAVIKVYNTSFLHANPQEVQIAGRPLRVRDFDWFSSKKTFGTPCLAAAIGKQVVFVLPGEPLDLVQSNPIS